MGSRLVVLALVFVQSAAAAVTLPYLIASHMVVQRGLPFHVWGTAEPGEAVAVEFRGASARSAADALGRWSVNLPPGGAGGPFVLTIRDTNTVTLDDILVGDVWIASGQSNMEWPVRWASDAATEA